MPEVCTAPAEVVTHFFLQHPTPAPDAQPQTWAHARSEASAAALSDLMPSSCPGYEATATMADQRNLQNNVGLVNLAIKLGWTAHVALAHPNTPLSQPVSPAHLKHCHYLAGHDCSATGGALLIMCMPDAQDGMSRVADAHWYNNEIFADTEAETVRADPLISGRS